MIRRSAFDPCSRGSAAATVLVTIAAVGVACQSVIGLDHYDELGPCSTGCADGASAPGDETAGSHGDAALDSDAGLDVVDAARDADAGSDIVDVQITDGAGGTDADATASCPDGSAAGVGETCAATCPAWVPSSGGKVPSHAVVLVSEEDARLFVCRVHLNDGAIIPAKLFRGYGCFFGDGTVEHGSGTYDALVAPSCIVRWQKVLAKVLPPDAIPAGSDARGVLHICRATVGGETHGGHVGATTGYTCRYSNGGGSFDVEDYEVLTR